MKTGSSKVARRYAKAMVQLCDERGDGDTVRQDLRRVLEVLAVNAEAAAFLANPVAAPDSRKAVLRTLVDTLKVVETTRNLLLLLLDRGRIAEIAGIAREFDLALNARTGRVQAELKTAVVLEEASLQKVRASLKQLLAKEVDLAATVDPEILGGLVVTVGNTVYDASVRNHLDRIRHRLIAP